jgi:hypothetical protein
MVNLTNSEIRKISQKRIKDREQQYAIMNWERPSLDIEEKTYQKLKSLQNSQWLFYSVYKFYSELEKKYQS